MTEQVQQAINEAVRSADEVVRGCLSSASHFLKQQGQGCHQPSAPRQRRVAR